MCSNQHNSMANNSSAAEKRSDFVIRDGVIKEQIEKEYDARERFEKWNFTRRFNEECLEIALEKGISAEEYKRMTTKRKGPKLPAVSTWDPASSGPMPRTTTGEIGWRSSRPGCNLEIMGPLYTSPRFTMEPPDSTEIQTYNFIHLG